MTIKPVPHHLTGEEHTHRREDNRAALLTAEDHRQIATHIVEIIKREGLGVNHECQLGMAPEDVDKLLEFVKDVKDNHDYAKKTLAQYAIKAAIIGVIATFLIGLSVKFGWFVPTHTVPAPR